MKLKIGEIARRSNIPASTIRYYVREGLLPKPEKANEKMSYYEEACIDRLNAIQELKGKRYYPLHLIKNILRRMDDGLSLQEAESVENAVFGPIQGAENRLWDQEAFLAATGLTKQELDEAQNLGILISFTSEQGKPLYNQDDILVARDGIKKLTGLGIQFRDLTFWVELGKKIVEQEMDLRRKVVEGKSLRENVAITAELTRMGDYYRDYIMRRLFQRQVEYNIQKSLLAREKRKL
ncbi:MAG: MerR family transcriptional regulator [Syntrophaceae bacterium]|jgi:DNA-binding transcriptional MerR regulator|nr:MerR family transcriptional regulator [Syntrophaceae bacterium]HQM46160.1 MerR family transcriptional regulator [Smithellaceae bacterium]